MEVYPSSIPEIILFKPIAFKDTRGSFFESYNLNKIKEVGVTTTFVQDNQSQSSRGVLRGLHYQMGAFAQAKLIRVIKGAVYDVAVDIRKGSPTYGHFVGATLSEENQMQMYIPRGFAHGFIVLENDTIFTYKCDNFYHKPSEGGLIWNDASIGIEWPIEPSQILLSEKDEILPTLKNCLNDFTYG